MLEVLLHGLRRVPGAAWRSLETQPGAGRAELAAGPHATADETERARCQDRLQWAAATFDAIPFDADAARAYGWVFAATTGRSARPRLADLMIASTAASVGLRLYTRNPNDLVGLDQILTVVGI